MFAKFMFIWLLNFIRISQLLITDTFFIIGNAIHFFYKCKGSKNGGRKSK